MQILRAVFCRFAGCNLWTGREADRAAAVCRFCDTDFVGTDGPGGGRFASAGELAEAVAGAGRGPARRHAASSSAPAASRCCSSTTPLVDACTTRASRSPSRPTARAAAPRHRLDLRQPEGRRAAGAARGDELKLVYPQPGPSRSASRPRLRPLLPAAHGGEEERKKTGGGLPLPAAPRAETSDTEQPRSPLMGGGSKHPLPRRAAPLPRTPTRRAGRSRATGAAAAVRVWGRARTPGHPAPATGFVADSANRGEGGAHPGGRANKRAWKGGAGPGVPRLENIGVGGGGGLAERFPGICRVTVRRPSCRQTCVYRGPPS